VLGQRSISRNAGSAGSIKVDAVSRATTSGVLMSDAIVRGARVVARSRGILPAPAAGKARLDVDRFAPADWPALEGEGSVAHLHLSYAEVRAKAAESGARKLVAGDAAARPQDSFADLYVALVTPANIGINLLDETWYGQYTAGRGIDDQLILIAGNGPYSFLLGPDWEHDEVVGPVELVQGDKTIRLSPKQVRALPFVHAKNAPELSERALVFLGGDSALDPSEPWTLRLLVGGESAGGQKTFTAFDLAYRLPEKYILKPPATAADAVDAGAPSREALPWQAIWSGHWVRIAILCAALLALTLILSLQARISRRRRLHQWLRIGFLTWTLVWLGWYAGAQLTVVNVITYIHTAVTDFRWDYVLADPLVAILSVFTLVGLFFWGRAAFCGWLCPFGALQELANKLARRLGVGQLTIPAAVDERLAVVKYALFLGLVGASFLSWDLAMAGTEIEPFKAAIILRFMTEWPMVAYAVAVLAAGLFVERFYCRFGCPLGGGLALFGHMRLFDTLKRHSECGRCHLCESVCPVGAIKRSGEIKMSECFYCLDCQVMYYDEHICPPLVRQRKQREAA
jgi:NosR/NirI family nitrous oxide reductase transcriptional regulator